MNPSSPVPVTLRPDYQGGSIVNLMCSISAAYGYRSPYYPNLTICPPERLNQFSSTVLLVVDGLGYNYVMDYGAGSVLYEHVEKPITSVFPATTAAAIPVFLTGNPPQQHGLTGWFTYLKELRAIVAVLPFVERGSKQPLATDRFDPLRLTNQIPLFERFRTTCHTVMPAEIAYSAFNCAFSRGATIHPYHSLRQMFATVHELIAQNTRGQYIYAYWPGFDRLAHSYGINSSRVRRHYELIDAELARFKGAIQGVDTLVIVTADHGFVDSDPAQMVLIADHPALFESLRMPLSGEPRLAYCYVHDDKRQQFEAYVNSELVDCVELCRSEDLIDQHYFGLGECHPALADRVGNYALIAKDGATIRDRVGGEGPIRDIGVHGGASADELYVPFIVLSG